MTLSKDAKFGLAAIMLVIAYIWTWALMKQYFGNIEVLYRYYPYYEVIIKKEWYYKPVWITTTLLYTFSVLYCLFNLDMTNKGVGDTT